MNEQFVVPLNGLAKGWTRSHDQIVLGEKLEDPYAIQNITKALARLYPTKAGREDLTPTDLYVRFLPTTDEEVETLVSLGVHLTDHPPPSGSRKSSSR